MAEAVGILEVFGLATAFVAADAGCKAANVRLECSTRTSLQTQTACQYRFWYASNSAVAVRGRYRRCGSRNGRSKQMENWCSAALRNTRSDRGYGKDAENERPGIKADG